MKSKTGKIAGCLAVLAALGGLLVLARSMNREEEEPKTDSTKITVTETDSDKITAISFLVEGKKASFSKTEDGWQYDEEPDFPLKQSSLENLVSKLSSLSAEQVLEEDTLALADYGLEEPYNEVTYSDGEETTTIHIGDKNETTDLWYLYLNENAAKVYLVDQSFQYLFPETMMKWAEGESLPTISADVMKRIQVERAENAFTVTRDEENAKWKVTGEDGVVRDADNDAVETLTGALASMSYGSMVEYNCADLSVYGLDKPQAVVRVRYTEEESSGTQSGSEAENDGESKSGSEAENEGKGGSEVENGGESKSSSEAENGSEGKNGSEVENDGESKSGSETENDGEAEIVTVEKELVLLIGSETGDGSYYVTAEGSREVHTMGSTVQTILGTDAEGYWSLYVCPVTASDIKSLEITYEGRTNKIVRKTEETTNEDGNPSQTVTYTLNGEEVDKTEASTLYSSVALLKAQKKDKTLQKTGEEELRIVIRTADGEMTVSCSPYDTSFYYAEDQQGVPSLINKNTIASLLDYYRTVIGER